MGYAKDRYIVVLTSDDQNAMTAYGPFYSSQKASAFAQDVIQRVFDERGEVRVDLCRIDPPLIRNLVTDGWLTLRRKLSRRLEG